MDCQIEKGWRGNKDEKQQKKERRGDSEYGERVSREQGRSEEKEKREKRTTKSDQNRPKNRALSLPGKTPISKRGSRGSLIHRVPLVW